MRSISIKDFNYNNNLVDGFTTNLKMNVKNFHGEDASEIKTILTPNLHVKVCAAQESTPPQSSQNLSVKRQIMLIIFALCQARWVPVMMMELMNDIFMTS